MRKSETYSSEIKSRIIRTDMTIAGPAYYLSDKYGWIRTIPDLSGKLKRGSLRFGEAAELAGAPGYDAMRQKRGR